jgi:hypothetical protein
MPPLIDISPWGEEKLSVVDIPFQLVDIPP